MAQRLTALLASSSSSSAMSRRCQRLFVNPWRVQTQIRSVSVRHSSITPAQGTMPPSVADVGETSVAEVSSGSAIAPRDATAPSGVRSIQYKGPIGEDTEGAAKHASMVGTMWGNIPGHVRASFDAVQRVDQAPTTAAPPLLDSLASDLKALASTAGLRGPIDRWLGTADPLDYYDGQIPLQPYKKGQTAAYNYPRILVPRELAYRFPLDMYVDPVFQTSDPALKLQMLSSTLFPRLQGHTTLFVIFSGQPLSGLFTGVRQWLDTVTPQFSEHPRTQVMRMHCAKGWFNRRTHQLTKFQLRRQVDPSEINNTFVYRGQWKWEYSRALHLYDPQLPVVLLLDRLAYVRWHAVGLPTEDATKVFLSLSRSLAHEKQSYA